MTADEGRKLKVGQRVIWTMDGMPGEVVEVGYAAVKIKWRDGKFAIFPFASDCPWETLEVNEQ